MVDALYLHIQFKNASQQRGLSPVSHLPTHIKKVVCYLRKSREDEEAEKRGEDTLANQRDMMVRDVLSRVHTEYDLAQEIASGDSIHERPIFQSLLPKLGGEYQGIACKDLSRLGRGSYSDMGIVYDIIRDRRIFILTKDAVYDPRNFSDLRMIRFSLFFNREEYEMTLWRLTEGKYDGARKGKWVAGSVPFGFEYNAKLQILVPQADAAKVVALIFALYTQKGLGFRAIATHLRRLGIKSPKGNEIWQPEVIHRILRNRAYNGTMAFRLTERQKCDGKRIRRPTEEHIVVDDAFPGIIDRTTWEAAQRRLAKGHARPKTKVDFSSSELAGLIECRTCQRKLIRQSATQRYRKQDGTESLYKKEFLYCARCGYAVKYRDCEHQLLCVLARLKPLDLHTLSTQLQIARARAHSANASTNISREHYEKQRSMLLHRLERAREFLLDGTLDKADYEEAKEKYSNQLAELEQAMLAFVQAASATSAMALAKTDPAVEQPAVSLLNAYHNLTDRARKNRLLSAIFHTVTLEVRDGDPADKRHKRFELYVSVPRQLFP